MINISVCIPTYNRKVYLEKAIRSVVHQLKPGDEIVVQDNHSTDDTEAHIKTVFHDILNINYTRNPENIGLVLNFGKVVEAARNDYIFLLTDDDYLLPEALNLARNFFLSSGALAFKTSCYTFHEKKKRGSLRMLFKDNITPQNITNEKASKIFHGSHVFTGFCFKKELFSWEDLISNKDNWYPSMLFMGKAGMSIGYLSEPTNVHIWENETYWGVSPEKRNELNIGQVNTILYIYGKKYIKYDHFVEIVYRHYRQWPYESNGALLKLLNFKDKLIMITLNIIRGIVKINHFLKKIKNKE